jgi:hypothetical protein
MLEILETIKKHGALGMTVIALIWMNSRLNSVEDKLFNCLSSNQEIRQASTHSKVEIKEKLIAILPNDRKNKRFIS